MGNGGDGKAQTCLDGPADKRTSRYDEANADDRLIIEKSAPTHTRDGQSANADNCEFGRFLDRGVADQHS